MFQKFFRKTTVIALFLLLAIGVTACKKESDTELDASRISALWGWFSKYADNVGKQIQRFTDNANNPKAIKKLTEILPVSGYDEIKRILNLNRRIFKRNMAKLNSVDSGRLAIYPFPLKNLPNGIPSKYEKAFEVLLENVKGYGDGKVAVRRFMAQMVERYSKEKGVSLEKAYELQLDAFVKTHFPTSAKPLPNEFAGVSTFYGHMIETKAPFLDVAFGPGGVLGPKNAPSKAVHGVFVHVEDFFEWELMCKMVGCGNVSVNELMHYVARSGLVEFVADATKKIRLLDSSTDAAKIAELNNEINKSLVYLGVSRSSKKYKSLLEGKEVLLREGDLSIPVKLLDWESKTVMNNATSLWDLFFDFQNLPDEAFKNSKSLRQAFGNPEAGFLASSMNVTTNPMYTGKPAVIEILFGNMGWH